MRCYFLIVVLLVLSTLPTQALEPAEVAVVANNSVSGSVDLARYYMKQRGIPKANLIRIRTTAKEFCSREDYENEIAQPIRDFLKSKSGIRCLVTMLGVPLRINPHAWSRDGKNELSDLREKREAIQAKLDDLPDKKSPQAETLKGQLSDYEARIGKLDKKDDRAAVDSELSLLLKESYPVKGWMPNPFYLGYKKQRLSVTKEEVIFISRLDAPSEKIVRRMIDDGIEAEKTGLHGTAYFDARFPKEEKAKYNAIELYDRSIHQAAEKVSGTTKMSVVVNDTQELFKAGEAPDAALYCGWYNVNHYVDAFDWVPGAVGYHVASGECGTLRKGSGDGWCKGLLEDGAAATLGPVGEPYLQAFPPPSLFFSLLVDGSYSLAEVYYLSLPHLSWQMTLVGDPLYRPFRPDENE